MRSGESALTRSIAHALRRGGDVCEVYIDDSVDTSDPPQVVQERRTSVLDRLRRQGADEADLEAVSAALGRKADAPSPLSRFVLVAGGETIVDETLEGATLAREIVTCSATQTCRRSSATAPTVCSTSSSRPRATGEIRLCRAGAAGSAAVVSESAHQGRTDSLHKAQSGAWSQNRHQKHVEEIWRQTQSELAVTVDRIVRENRPALLLVAGDIRARQLLEGELSAESRTILRVLPVDTRADGSDDSALNTFVDEEVERLLAAEIADVVDRLNIHGGRGDNTVEFTVGGIVHALAGAQVDTLVLDTDRLAGRLMLALGDAPWVATAPEDALNAPVLGEVEAVSALTRAALLTDARVLFVEGEGSLDPIDTRDEPRDIRSHLALGLPEGVQAAALLRWTEGPPVPGT